MRSNRARLSAAALVAAVLASAGCEYPQPYVHAYKEFDRSSPNFRREPAGRTWVTVCTRPFREPDARVAALADQLCQKHGKTAVEASRRFGECPLLLSKAVVFRCTNPAT